MNFHFRGRERTMNRADSMISAAKLRFLGGLLGGVSFKMAPAPTEYKAGHPLQEIAAVLDEQVKTDLPAATELRELEAQLDAVPDSISISKIDWSEIQR